MHTHSSSVPLGLSARLREATWSQHQALENLPFSQALLAQTLPVTAYIGQLAAYYPIHDKLETLCSTSPLAEVQAVWHEEARRADLLRADLEYFHRTPETEMLLPPTRDFLTWLEHAASSPAILGCLYVFEGSMLGARLLQAKVREMYTLDTEGCRYYTASLHQSADFWPAFKQRLDQAIHTPDAEQTVIDGARQTFEAVGAILRALAR